MDCFPRRILHDSTDNVYMEDEPLPCIIDPSKLNIDDVDLFLPFQVYQDEMGVQKTIKKKPNMCSIRPMFLPKRLMFAFRNIFLFAAFSSELSTPLQLKKLIELLKASEKTVIVKDPFSENSNLKVFPVFLQFSADMPAAALPCGALQQGANVPCRMCYVRKENLWSWNDDRQFCRRSSEKQAVVRKNSRSIEELKNFGFSDSVKKNPLSKLKTCISPVSSPQCVLHTYALGMIKHVVECVIACLSHSGLTLLTRLARVIFSNDIFSFDSMIKGNGTEVESLFGDFLFVLAAFKVAANLYVDQVATGLLQQFFIDIVNVRLSRYQTEPDIQRQFRNIGLNVADSPAMICITVLTAVIATFQNAYYYTRQICTDSTEFYSALFESIHVSRFWLYFAFGEKVIDFPKNHSMLELAFDIQVWGSAVYFDTRAQEATHKDSRKDVEKNPIGRREACTQIIMYHWKRLEYRHYSDHIDAFSSAQHSIDRLFEGIDVPNFLSRKKCMDSIVFPEDIIFHEQYQNGKWIKQRKLPDMCIGGFKVRGRIGLVYLNEMFSISKELMHRIQVQYVSSGTWGFVLAANNGVVLSVKKVYYIL